MMRKILFGLLCLTSVSAFAMCDVQSVAISSRDKDLGRWDVTTNALHRTKLLNGLEIGIKVEPAEAKIYRKFFDTTGLAKSDELVRVTIYDMSGATPSGIHQSWAGANSDQAYGPGGIWNDVVVVAFRKTRCVDQADLAPLGN